MKGKKRITAFIALFMAVTLCLQTAVPVAAYEADGAGDAIIPDTADTSEELTISRSESNDGELTNEVSESRADISEKSSEDSLSDSADESEILLTDTKEKDTKENETDLHKQETDSDKKENKDKDTLDTNADYTISDSEPSGQQEEDNNPESTDEPEIITEVNPLYEDVVDESEIPRPSELQSESEPEQNEDTSVLRISPKTYLAASPTSYTTISDAAAYVRKCLEARESEIIVYLDLRPSEYGNDTSKLWHMVFDRAKAHTGTGTQGDAISYQYGGVSGIPSAGRLTYTVSYYTTKAQENELTAKVSQVLSSLNLNGCSDQVKLARIYKYITDNVAYDRTHLYDATYKLKYTAYAAMINKTAVCQGYSVLFYRMALQAGVDARVISGKGNGGDHAWNIARINGKYYNLDSTWDAGKNPVDYGYFLNNTTFDDSHVRGIESNSDLDYTSDEFNRQYPMASSSLSYPESELKHATGVRFEQGESVVAALGASVDLKAVVEPADACDTYVDFEVISSTSATGSIYPHQMAWSNDRGICTVTPTVKESGKITVRATTRDGNHKAECTIIFREGKPLAITEQPSDVSKKTGEEAEFSISATGDGLKYKWKYSTDNGATYADLNTDWMGSNTATLKVKVIDNRDGYKYRCEVTDVTGMSVVSNPATLTVIRDSQGGGQGEGEDAYVQSDIISDAGQCDYLTQGCVMELTGTVTGTNREIEFSKVKGDGVSVSKISAGDGRYRLRIDATGCNVEAGNTAEVVIRAVVKNGMKDGNGKITDLVREKFCTVTIYPRPTLAYNPESDSLSYTAPVKVNTGTMSGRDDASLDKDDQITYFTGCKGVIVKVWKNKATGAPLWSSAAYTSGGNSSVIRSGSIVTGMVSDKKLTASGDYSVRIYPCNGANRYNNNIFSEVVVHIYKIDVTGRGVSPASYYALKDQEIEIKAVPQDATLSWNEDSYWTDDESGKEGQTRKVRVTGDKTYTAVIGAEAAKITLNANVPSGTTVKKGTRVSLSVSPAAANIYYTLDGTSPDGDYDGKCAEGSYKYTEPIAVNEDTVIKAKAVLYGYRSAEAVFSYTVDKWGSLDDKDLSIPKEMFDNDPEKVPASIWYMFEGDDNVYMPSSDAQITQVKKGYTGGRIIFNEGISVFYGTDRLVEGRDYKVVYSNNTEPGAASDGFSAPSFTVKGIGNYYKGSSVFRFTISGENAVTVAEDVKIACLNTEPEYTGSTLTLEDLYMADSKYGYNEVTLYTEKDGNRVVLTEEKDYTFDRDQLRKTGSFTLKFVLTGNYTGTVISSQINVNPYNVTKHLRNADSKINITMDLDENGKAAFNKAGAQPAVTVKFYETPLKEGVDYSVTYSKNKRLGQRAKAKIKFTGCFKGSATEYYEIAKKHVRNLKVYADDVKCRDGEDGTNNFKVLPKVLDDGKSVSKRKDIEKFSKTEGCSYYYASGPMIGEKIADDATVAAGTLIEVCVRVAARPGGSYEGVEEISGYYRIYGSSKNIKKAVAVTHPMDYDEGNEIIPVNKVDFTLTMPGESEPLGSEYFDIISIKQNRFIGTATVEVRGKNGYGGVKRFRIKIRKRSMTGWTY